MAMKKILFGILVLMSYVCNATFITETDSQRLVSLKIRLRGGMYPFSVSADGCCNIPSLRLFHLQFVEVMQHPNVNCNCQQDIAAITGIPTKQDRINKLLSQFYSETTAGEAAGLLTDLIYNTMDNGEECGPPSPEYIKDMIYQSGRIQRFLADLERVYLRK